MAVVGIVDVLPSDEAGFCVEVPRASELNVPERLEVRVTLSNLLGEADSGVFMSPDRDDVIDLAFCGAGKVSGLAARTIVNYFLCQNAFVIVLEELADFELVSPVGQAGGEKVGAGLVFVLDPWTVVFSLGYFQVKLIVGVRVVFVI